MDNNSEIFKQYQKLKDELLNFSKQIKSSVSEIVTSVSFKDQTKEDQKNLLRIGNFELVRAFIEDLCNEEVELVHSSHRTKNSLIDFYCFIASDKTDFPFELKKSLHTEIEVLEKSFIPNYINAIKKLRGFSE